MKWAYEQSNSNDANNKVCGLKICASNVKLRNAKIDFLN